MMKALFLFRKKSAFTLIELIITIVVVGIIALPVSITLSKHVQSVFISQDYTMAINLASFEMEKVINTPYANIAVGTFPSPNYQGYAYDLTTTVSEVTSGIQAYKFVTVSVTKAGSATILGIPFKTYIVKNVTWGL